jgi:hypothetical protein
MSKAEPVFGIDIAYPYQKDIDLGLVNEQGYKFVVAKATEGPYRDGTSYTNPRTRSSHSGANERNSWVSYSEPMLFSWRRRRSPRRIFSSRPRATSVA